MQGKASHFTRLDKKRQDKIRQHNTQDDTTQPQHNNTTQHNTIKTRKNKKKQCKARQCRTLTTLSLSLSFSACSRVSSVYFCLCPVLSFQFGRAGWLCSVLLHFWLPHFAISFTFLSSFCPVSCLCRLVFVWFLLYLLIML